MKSKIKITLSQGAITFLFFFGFLLGIVITAVALYGNQIPLKCFEAGNTADWLAAIGTWVIGVGAVSLAASDRSLKLRERQERRISQLESNLEDVQKVARYARSASTEFQDAVETLTQEYRRSRFHGFKDSVALPHIRRTAYVLAWTPAQLRLLPASASALADDVNARAERIVSGSDGVPGKPGVIAQGQAAIELIEVIGKLYPLLAELKDAAETEAISIRDSIERIQRRLDSEID
jgi:hypothetical protein